MALPVTRPLVSFHVQPAEEKGTTWRARLLLEALTWRWHASLLLPSIGENEAHGHADSIGLGSVVPGLVYLPGWLWFRWQYLSNFKMRTLFEIAVLLLGIHYTEILVAVHGNLCTDGRCNILGNTSKSKRPRCPGQINSVESLKNSIGTGMEHCLRYIICAKKVTDSNVYIHLCGFYTHIISQILYCKNYST